MLYLMILDDYPGLVLVKDKHSEIYYILTFWQKMKDTNLQMNSET